MLFDTCVVIDLIRGHDAAGAFVKALSGQPALSVVTVTELYGGVRSASERRIIDHILATNIVHEVTLEIATLAGEYVRQFGPSHSVDAVDALIAATARVNGLELATLNLKHFPMFKGLRRPYPAG